MTGDLRVTVKHLRAARLCASGGRDWCARNDFSWSDFVANGVPVSALRPLNDAFANRLIAEAEKEAARG